MKLSHAIESYQKYHSFNSKKNTLKNYKFLFTRFNDEFGNRDLDSITPDEILSFLTRLTEGTKQTTKRNRIMMDLMAKGGMRIGEVLKIRPVDVKDRKITLPDPKSGRESEIVFIPQKIADRLRKYIQDKGIDPEKRIFPITYNAARVMVNKAGKMIGIHLRPHDLRRSAATYASRSGTPIEIVSKVILRHTHLSTTQRYLGKVSDLEAMRWIENMYG